MVCRITGVPEPMVRGTFGERVWPAMRYWEFEFVVRVCPFTMTGMGLGGLSRACGETTGIVVTICEPWALVDVTITPGACDVVTTTLP